MTTKRIKCLEINLIKGVKTYTVGEKKYETLLREIKHLNKGRNAAYLLGRGLNLVRMAILPQTVGRFNTITFKLPMVFFDRMENPIFKFIQNCNGP